MKLRHLLLASSAIAMLGAAGIAAPALAADVYVAPPVAPVVVPDQHRFAGTIEAGASWTRLMYDDVSIADDDDDDDDEDLHSFFGKGAVLFGPAGSHLNIQGDFSFNTHRFDLAPSVTGAVDVWHAGGIVFWRDPSWGLVGIDASYISLDSVVAIDAGRVGLRGEYFFGPSVTLGGGVGYATVDSPSVGSDSIDANLWVAFYPTDNIGLKLRGDYGSSDYEYDLGGTDIYAISGEGEYLLSQVPMSIFAGARYVGIEDHIKGLEFSADATQVFGGLRFYFGSGGPGTSLAQHHRNNTLDNTSLFYETLPLITDIEL